MKVFCDGSCLNNGKKNSKGGYGIFFGNDDPRNVSEALTCEKITNQVAELTAIQKTIEILIKDNCKDIVYIYTDSKYVIGIFTEWAKTWEKNNWFRKAGTIQNLELIKDIYNKMKNVNIIFKHVRAHTDPPSITSDKYELWYGNQKADQYAVEGSNK